MIHAAESIRKSGVSLAGDIVIACVLAELQGGLGTKYLLDKGYQTDSAVVTEPYGAHNVVTQHGGMTMFSLHVKGRHPGGDDLHGVDAIPQMIKAINAIYQNQTNLPALGRWGSALAQDRVHHRRPGRNL